MDKLVRKWLLGLAFVSIGTACLLIFGLWLALTTTTRNIGHLLICFVGFAGFVYCLYYWWRFFEGKVASTTHQILAPSGGEVTVAEPQRPFELWIFCSAPLANYYGNIYISRSSTGEGIAVKVPKRNFFYGRRNNFTPFVWKSTDAPSKSPAEFKVRLDLVPSFEDERADEPKYFTFLVKVTS